MLNKEEILNWNSKYDKDHPWWVAKERELGDKFRKEQQVTKDDLKEVVEWKFLNLPYKNDRLRDVEKIDDAEIRRKSHEMFSQVWENEIDRINNFRFSGVGAATISVVLTFYDPENYGVFDRHVWRELFGRESEDEYLFSTANCVKVLSELRKIAGRDGLHVRTVEKAYFKKNHDEHKKKT